MSTHRSPRARRARRVVAALAASGALAIGLTACHTQPGAAGFVAQTRYTQDQVNTIFDATRTQAKPAPAAGDYAGIRQSIARNLVMRDLCKRVAADKGVKVPAPDYAKLAANSRLPATNEYFRDAAYTISCINALGKPAGTAKPSDSDLRQIYDSVAAQVQGGLEPFSTAKKKIASGPQVGQAIAVRNLLRDGVKRYHVNLNPLYGDPVFPVNAGAFIQEPDGTMISGNVALSLGKADPDVVVSPAASSDLAPQG